MNGCILILVALGLSIVFGLMGIINFAHGIFYMLGAYAGWLTVHLTGSFWLALLVAPVTVGMVGVLVERCLLYTSPSPRDGLLSRMPSSA